MIGSSKRKGRPPPTARCKTRTFARRRPAGTARRPPYPPPLTLPASYARASIGVATQVHAAKHDRRFYFSRTRIPCGSARSTPAASTLLILTTLWSSPPLPPCLTLITPRPGVLPVAACGLPLRGLGPLSDTKIRLPEGEVSARSGVG